MSGVRKKQDRRAIPLEYDTSGLANAPQQRRSQDLSRRILEAAERVLRREGLEGFTIQDVAAEAGVSVGGIYGRFKNRDELLSAIHGEVLGKIQSHLEGVAEQTFGSLEEASDVFTTELVNVIHEVGDLLPVIQRSGQTAATVVTVEAAIRAAFAKATRPFHHEIRHSEPALATRFVVHLVLASVVRERNTNPAATGRTIGWDNLRRELPRVARAVLTGAY